MRKLHAYNSRMQYFNLYEMDVLRDFREVITFYTDYVKTNTPTVLNKASILLPLTRCLYFWNPLSTFTRHIIMLYGFYYYVKDDNKTNALEHITLVSVAFDCVWVVQRYTTWIAFFCVLCVHVAARLQHPKKIIFYYLFILLFWDIKKWMDMTLMYVVFGNARIVSQYDIACNNIITYMFLQRLFCLT